MQDCAPESRSGAPLLSPRGLSGARHIRCARGPAGALRTGSGASSASGGRACRALGRHGHGGRGRGGARRLLMAEHYEPGYAKSRSAPGETGGKRVIERPRTSRAILEGPRRPGGQSGPALVPDRWLSRGSVPIRAANVSKALQARDEVVGFPSVPGPPAARRPAGRLRGRRADRASGGVGQGRRSPAASRFARQMDERTPAARKLPRHPPIRRGDGSRSISGRTPEAHAMLRTCPAARGPNPVDGRSSPVGPPARRAAAIPRPSRLWRSPARPRSSAARSAATGLRGGRPLGARAGGGGGPPAPRPRPPVAPPGAEKEKRAKGPHGPGPFCPGGKGGGAR